MIIGVGQYVHRAESLDDALEPVALMERAVLAASADAELDGPPTAQERGGERGERKQAPHGELGAVVLSGRDAGAGPRRVFAANLVAHSLTLPLFSRSFPSPCLLPQQRSSGGDTAAVLRHVCCKVQLQLPKAEKRAII